MDFVFRLIDQIRQEMVYDELRSPGEGRRSEFDFGRLHGMLLVLETLQQQIKQYAEELEAEQDRREREF